MSFSSKRVKKKIAEKNTTRAKDELEFATNWMRVFVDIYKRIKWLNAFAVINEVAMQKSVQKFTQALFEINDNVIDKKL